MARNQRMRGIMMLDVMVGAAVLGIAVLGTIAAIPTASNLQQGLREREDAYWVLQQKCEELRQLGATEAFQTYNIYTSDAPLGPGTGRPSYFDVAGLQAVNPDGHAGHISFPIYKMKGTTVVIDERQEAPTAALNMPRDLDGDKVLEAEVPADQVFMMPVKVSVEWTGVGGTQYLEAVLILVNS
jgi:Tfp pilus assembly protein PilV